MKNDIPDRYCANCGTKLKSRQPTAKYCNKSECQLARKRDNRIAKAIEKAKKVAKINLLICRKLNMPVENRIPMCNGCKFYKQCEKFLYKKVELLRDGREYEQ